VALKGSHSHLPPIPIDLSEGEGGGGEGGNRRLSRFAVQLIGFAEKRKEEEEKEEEKDLKGVPERA